MIDACMTVINGHISSLLCRGTISKETFYTISSTGRQQNFQFYVYYCDRKIRNGTCLLQELLGIRCLKSKIENGEAFREMPILFSLSDEFGSLI